MKIEYETFEARPGVFISKVKLQPNGAGFVREHVAAAYIGISLSTLRRMRKKKEGIDEADIKCIRGAYWYRLEALLTYVEEVCAVRAA